LVDALSVSLVWCGVVWCDIRLHDMTLRNLI
jgi:hypothetical protein